MHIADWPPSAAALSPNPVWRSYLGGSVLRAFRGHAGTPDDHFPEDWLASTVRARNGVHAQHPSEGLSLVGASGAERRLPELLAEDPGFWLGPRSEGAEPTDGLGVLWKLLDSSVRLQLQAHPGKEFALRHLRSGAGKTECWHILSTRGEARVYLGFQRPPSRAAWARMIRDQRVNEMLACFDPIPARAGETYVVPAGLPHAIGAGVFMLELQEPTDWVVRCETTNAGLTLPPEACFMGLDLETCLDVFDYECWPIEKVRGRLQQEPRKVAWKDDYGEEELIGPAFHEYFRLHRMRGSGTAAWPGNEFMLLIVLQGQASLSSGAASQPVAGGQTWLLPGGVPCWHWLRPEGEWQILLAKLPLPPGKRSPL